MRNKQIAWISADGCCSRCLSSRESKLRELYRATVAYLWFTKNQGQGSNDTHSFDDGETSFLEANNILKYV